MPSPRDQALATNRSDGFDRDVERDYDAVAGAPAGTMPSGPPPDYAANPSNPPEPAAPAANLKR
jgi:hypothetical protein